MNSFENSIWISFARWESQRDSIIQPRVARNELPWVMRSFGNNSEGVVSRANDATPSGLEKYLWKETQGSPALRSNLGLSASIPLGLPNCYDWSATQCAPSGIFEL
jgi:hypothetical protein